VSKSSVRRVITGQSDSGATVVASDEEIDPVAVGNGALFWLIWGAERIPLALPTDGRPDFARTRFPLPSGVRVSVTEFAAAGSESVAAPRAVRGEVPGDASQTVTRDSSTGMHMTNTVVIAIVLSGEVGLEHSEGVEVVLKAGDVLVQNGGIHGWRPRQERCRVAFVILGAERETGSGEKVSES
jgi:hypothetical protein